MFDILADLPTEERPAATSLYEAPANTWADSPAIQRPVEPKKHARRPQIVINNTDDITRKTIPGNNSFSGAVKDGKSVALFSDSICNRMGKKQLSTKLNCKVNKKTFPGATTDDLFEHHMLPTLKKNTPDNVIIHIGVNDILAKGTPDGGLTSSMASEVAKDIIKCGEVCRAQGVNKICISSILPFKGRRAQLTVNQINNNLARLCKEMCFDFILNDNIIYDNSRGENILFYSDGLHLNDRDRDVLIDNFSNYIH
jgi:lysophospholipase L1-like esterase